MAIKYYGFLTEWFRTWRVVRSAQLGLAAWYPVGVGRMASWPSRAVPPYAQYGSGDGQAGRPWQVVLAGWPRPRELSMGTQERMAPQARHTWPSYDPADHGPDPRFEVFILQRIPRTGDHSHHCAFMTTTSAQRAGALE